MIRKAGIAIMAVIIVGFGAEFIYAKLKFESSSSQDLNGRLATLQSQNAQLSAALKEKDVLLKDLSDVQAIRQSLNNAQVVIAQMNTQLTQVVSEKAALQQANFGLTSRLENTTRELVQAMDDLKRARSQVSGLATTPAAPGGALEGNIKDLMAERDRLKQQLANVTSAADRSGGPIKNMQETIVRLTKELAQKNEDAAALEAQLKQGRPARDSGRLKEQEQTIAQLQDENQLLTATIARMRRLQADSAREAADAQAQVDQLQEKLSTVSRRKENSNEVDDLQQQLAAKTEQANTLQKNLEAAKQKLVEREQEQKAIEAKITQLESMTASLQDELKKRKSSLDENDSVSSSMRQQVAQLSNVLAKKEIELEDKAKELAALNEQSYSFKVRIAQLEEELNGARDRQKKTMDDLYQAVKLNAAMQERMLGASQSLGSQGVGAGVADQQKADQLKRKIEVILEPEK